MLPPLKNYVPGVAFEGTRDVRVVDHAIGHGAQAKMAPAPAPANNALSESAMTPVAPASDSPPAEDQDMEVDDYATCPSLPSPVSYEDDYPTVGPVSK